jgi:hypothetical protein
LTDVFALVTVLLCMGVFLVLGALIFLAVRFSNQWALFTLRRHPPTTIGSWRGGGRVSVEAHSEYGEAGRQTAPATGEDCAWFHMTLIRKPSRRMTLAEDNPEHDVLLELVSPAWPAIADETGRIAVDPRMFELPGRREPAPTETTRLTYRVAEPVRMPPVVPREAIDDLRRGEKLVLTEVRLPRGRPIFALGRPAGGAFVPSRGSLSVFTSDSRAKVLADRLEDNRVALGAALVMLVSGVVLAGGSAAAMSALH